MNFEIKQAREVLGAIAVAPLPLNSLKAICEAFSRGRSTVKSWEKAGAPISREGKGVKTRYATEYNLLLNWLVSRRG